MLGTPKLQRFIYLLTLLCVFNVHADSTVYKYKNEAGKWVYTDQRPQKAQFEQLAIEVPKQVKIEPSAYYIPRDDRYAMMIRNPFEAPIEVLISHEKSKLTFQAVIEAEQSKMVGMVEQPSQYQYRHIIGDPTAVHSDYDYRFPIETLGTYRISQGFKGRYSHFREPNLYAVDIAVPMGTDLVAARSGIVFATKNDYHMSGRGGYFLDKANYVKILHEDGTYAIYAHLLMDSVVVKPGDHVKVGQKIGRSGSSGYSTGPHLHFVIRRNEGMRIRSVPFKMIDKFGQSVNIFRGTIVSG